MDNFNSWQTVETSHKIGPRDSFLSNTDGSILLVTKAAEDGFSVSITDDLFNFTSLFSAKTGPQHRLTEKAVTGLNSFFFVGGALRNSSQVVYLKDCWIFNGSDFVEVKNDIIPEIGNHTVSYYNGHVYVFGGKSTSKIYNSMYKYNLTDGSFKEVFSLTSAPTPRFGHTTSIIKESLYLFGGYDGNRTLSDLYEFSLLTSMWYPVNFVGEFKPPAVYRHSAVTINSHLIIFGGINSDNNKKERSIYSYCALTNVFELKICSNAHPKGLTFTSALLKEDELYVFGGITQEDEMCGEVKKVKLRLVDKKESKEARKEFKLSDNVEELKSQLQELLTKYEGELNKNMCKLLGKQNLFHERN